MHEATEALADEDYSRDYYFVLSGEEFGTCYLTYGNPEYLFGKSYMFYVAAKSAEEQSSSEDSLSALRQHHKALAYLKVSMEAMVEIAKYAIPVRLQPAFDKQRSLDLELDAEILHNAAAVTPP
jgi:hypothetical protein